MADDDFDLDYNINVFKNVSQSYPWGPYLHRFGPWPYYG